MGRNSISYSSFAFSIEILTERGTSLFVNQFKDLEKKKKPCASRFKVTENWKSEIKGIDFHGEE